MEHSSLFRHYCRPLMDLIYPRVCALCNRPIVEANYEAICLECWRRLSPAEQCCLRCGAPLGHSEHPSKHGRGRCFYCERRKWSFRRAYCYTAYHGPAARIAKKIKQPGHEPLAIEIGRRMASWLTQSNLIDTSRFDLVIAIPQHWIRRVLIRYNQAEVLAEQIGLGLTLPIDRNALYRTRLTEKQGTKSITERLKDVQDSFACKPRHSLVGAKILLVDDVVTSGATASDAARALRKAGVARVDVVAFARGVGAFQKRTAKPPVPNNASI
jgi:ComF family protein